MNTYWTLYHAIARRIIQELKGKFKVTPFDSQLDDGQTNAGLHTHHILVRFQTPIEHTSPGGAHGGQAFPEMGLELWVKIADKTDYLTQMDFTNQVGQALHGWRPGDPLGLSPLMRKRTYLDDGGKSNPDFRVHRIHFATSGPERGTNREGQGAPLDPDTTPIYISMEAQAELTPDAPAED